MILATPVAMSPTYVLCHQNLNYEILYIVFHYKWVKISTHINWSLLYTLSSLPHWDHSKGENPETGVVIKKPVLVPERIGGAYDGCRGK